MNKSFVDILKEKVRSLPMWIALAALIYFIAHNWMKVDIPDWDKFVELFLGLLIAFGVVNDPNSRNTL